MAKDKISDYSTTANSNTDIGGINVDEGCAPSGINDAIRTLMAQLKTWQSGGQDVYIHPAGTASAPSITANGDTNTGIFFPAADTVGITTGGSERARVDSAGNLGLGVTPSAWSGSAANGVLQLKNGGVLFTNTLKDTYLGANYYFDGSVNKYISSGYAAQFGVSSSTGGFSWNSATSGSAGDTATLSTLMTLLQNGNLGIGVTSPAAKLHVASGGTLLQGSTNPTYTGTNYATLNINNNSADGTVDFTQGIVFTNNSTNTTPWGQAGIVTTGSSGYGGVLIFGTDSGTQDVTITERARITSNGIFLVGTTSAPSAVSGSVASLGYSTRSGTNGSFSGNNFNINWTGNANLWIDSTNLGTFQFSSDHRIKKNIATQVASGIDRVMLLRPVTYELADYGDLFKEDGVLREGFIAHEVQEVIPSGAEGEKDQEDRIQSLRLDAILSVAVKAIQEQQAIITQLQADVAALKG
jgi:hypothetical protein